MSEMQEKIRDYLQFGVLYVWVLDPRTKRAFVFTKAGMSEPADGVLRTEKAPIVMSISDIFGEQVAS